MGYSLWSLSSANYPSEKSIALLVQLLLQRQAADGHWLGGNGRPPLEYYSVSATALAIKGIVDYATPGMQKQVKDAKQRALEWMTQVQTPANEEKAFQLLGLSWMNAPKALIKEKAKLLLLKQHSNGGWSQLDSLDPDAYATGQALYALHESGGLVVADPAYQKGIDYLLANQHTDGSWEVQTRTHAFQPPVVSGFPFDANQFISAAGSSWATLALLAAVE